MARYQKPFAPGDVVWGPDAYHDDDPYLRGQATRPWLVVANESYPGFGEQYLCCGLTSNVTAGPSFVPLDPGKDWETGGTARRSRIDTETIFTMKHRWILDYSGRVAHSKLREARSRIRAYF